MKIKPLFSSLFSSNSLSSVIQSRLFSFNSSSTPSLQTLISLLNSSFPAISNSKSLHGHLMKSNYINQAFLNDRLIAIYAKLGFYEDAHKLFDEMPERDLVSWNSLISGFSRNGCLKNCLIVFSRMRYEVGLGVNEVSIISIVCVCIDNGALNVGKCIHGFALKSGNLMKIKVVNSLINMYGKLGCLDFAYELFDSITVPNLVSWNSILDVNAKSGRFNEVVCRFNSMRRAGVEPDEGTMVSLIRGCTELGVVKQAMAVHGCFLKSGFGSYKVVATAVVSLYAKCGRLGDSEEVFREMRERDRVSWTAMLASYAVHGCGREAIMIFEEMVMNGIRPDHVTFTHLLSACSHSGLVCEGKKYFDDMWRVYGVEPKLDHYCCIVDLFGRVGQLNDAYMMIKSMPMEPNAGVWGALLGACRIHRNIELGKEAAENLFALEPLDHRNYLMLSNIYSDSGKWVDASKIRSLMKEKRLIRNSGISIIDHQNKLYRFVAGDHSHPESEKIHAKLDELIRKIRGVGFKPRTEFVLHNVDEDVKEDMISKHSEKLALAFGLLVLGKDTPITIAKNLRICGDCHSMVKLVSLVENRTIVIRDPKRFHHFANGACSCGDYW